MLLLLLILHVWKRRKQLKWRALSNLANSGMLQDQQTVKSIVKALKEPMPTCMVDIGAFDSNTDHFALMARHSGKTIRVATKSIRVPWLIARLQQRHPDVFQGLMCFSAIEAEFWFRQGGKPFHPLISARYSFHNDALQAKMIC
jgi:hypothetical protein